MYTNLSFDKFLEIGARERPMNGSHGVAPYNWQIRYKVHVITFALMSTMAMMSKYLLEKDEEGAVWVDSAGEITVWEDSTEEETVWEDLANKDVAHENPADKDIAMMTRLKAMQSERIQLEGM